MIEILSLLILNMLLLATGQIMWKMGVTQIGTIGWHNILNLASSPWVWGGITLFGIATVVWLMILSRANLSAIYPMQSLVYILGMVGGIFFFGEKVSIEGWVGAMMIILGVILTSSSIR